jgi:hypothetical protein
MNAPARPLTPARRRRRCESEPGSVAELRDRLSFTRSDMKPEEWSSPACWWNVGETAAMENGHPRVLANYTLDCVLGRALGIECVEVLLQYPQHQDVLHNIFNDMVRRGRLSGIEITFIGHVTRNLTLRSAPSLSIIKARVEQPDGSHGIYQQE